MLQGDTSLLLGFTAPDSLPTESWQPFPATHPLITALLPADALERWHAGRGSVWCHTATGKQPRIVGQKAASQTGRALTRLESRPLLLTRRILRDALRSGSRRQDCKWIDDDRQRPGLAHCCLAATPVIGFVQDTFWGVDCFPLPKGTERIPTHREQRSGEPERREGQRSLVLCAVSGIPTGAAHASCSRCSRSPLLRLPLICDYLPAPGELLQ